MSMVPTLPPKCQLLHHLWNLAVQQAQESGELPNHVFGAIGLYLVDPRTFPVFFPTPKNATVFARTGGDGVHYSLLHLDNEATDLSPVVMTVPFFGTSPNVIVGETFLEFLCLGCK